MACYCYRFTCLIARLIGLLILAPIVFFFGGALGTYETMFGDLSITRNTTMAAQRAMQFVKDTYITGVAPSPFMTWGSIALAVYVILCVIYILIKFSCICHECSKAIDESDATARRAFAELRSHQGRPNRRNGNDDEAYELASLRKEFELAQRDNNDRV